MTPKASGARVIMGGQAWLSGKVGETATSRRTRRAEGLPL